MNSRAPNGIAIAVLSLAACTAKLSAQKPVVTLTASTTRIAERLTLNRTPTRTLNTTTSRLSASTASTAPTSNSVTFTVSRTGPTTPTDLTVRYSVGGTALSANDYSGLTGTITIPRSASSATITVTAIDDAEDELDETIVVDLVSTATSPYVLADPASATITIVDDDDVRLSDLDIVTDTIVAGSSVDVRLTLSGAAPPGGTTVALSSSDGSVSAPTISIAAGTRVGVGRIGTTERTSPLSVVVTGSAGGVARRDTLVLYPAPRVQGIDLTPDVLFGGRSTTGTIRLASAAPPIGGTVDLKARVILQVASRTAVTSTTSTTTFTGATGALSSAVPVSFPASVPVAPGASTASISLTTNEVASATRVEITAVLGSTSARDTVIVHPMPTIASADLAPNPVEGGDPVTSTIRLENPIPAGLTWSTTFTSTGALLASQSHTLFAAGASEWSGSIGTRPVSQQEQACLRISGTGTSSTASGGCVTILPPAVTGFAITPDAVFGGRPVGGTITTSHAVSTGSQPVLLTVQVLSPAGAASPLTVSRVDIPAGQNTVSFSFPSSDVSQAVTLEISAPGGRTDTVTVHPMPAIASADLAPAKVEGGDPVTSTIRLERPIPAGLTWSGSFSSTGPLMANQALFSFRSGASEWRGPIGTRPVSREEGACLRIVVPGTASMTSGGCVTVTPPPPTLVSFQIEAKLGADVLSENLTVQAPRLVLAPRLSGLGVTPTGKVISGANIDLTVTLDRNASAGGMSVELRTSNRNAIDPPASLTVPQGQRSATVSIRTSAVASNTQVTLDAILNGAGERQAVALVPQPIDRIQIQNTVQGNTQTQATVRLSRPAPAGGLVVPVSSSNPAAAAVPASVTVPAGSTRASFAVQTGLVRQTTDVTITAGAGQATATFRVRAR